MEKTHEDKILEEHKFITDPSYTGPGLWVIIHLMALKADTPKKVENFCDFVRFLCDNHMCPNCREHCKEYIKLNPPEKDKNTSFNISGNRHHLGMFYWAFIFHNAVNERIGKTKLTLEQAFILYNEEQKCDIVCRIEKSNKSKINSSKK